MRSNRIRVGDMVNYNKITGFGPAKVVKVLQMREIVRGFPRTSGILYGIEIPEPFNEGGSCEYAEHGGDIVTGTNGREGGCVWATAKDLELVALAEDTEENTKMEG